MNGDGKVAFRATLKSGDSAGKAAGIWSDFDGALRLIARQGDQLTGTLAGTHFTAFTSVALPDVGSPVFLAKIGGTGVNTTNNVGLWTTVAGVPQLLIRKGDPVSVNGAMAKVTSFSALRPLPFVAGQRRSAGADGGVAVLANFADGKATILRIRNGGAEVVARKQDELTGAPIEGKLASVFSPAIAGTGDVAWRAVLAADTLKGITAANAKCVFKQSAVNFRSVIARSGSALAPAPGVTAGQFASFSDPVVDGSGRVAFRALLRQGIGDVGPKNGIGLWAEFNGALALAARQGSPAPGVSAGINFTSFISFVLPDVAGVVTLAKVAGPGVTTDNNTGIWAVDKDGLLQLVLRRGDKLQIDGKEKTVAAVKIFAARPYISGEARGFAGDGDLSLQATFSDLSIVNLRVVFP
jgi:hypothetical protein